MVDNKNLKKSVGEVYSLPNGPVNREELLVPGADGLTVNATINI